MASTWSDQFANKVRDFLAAAFPALSWRLPPLVDAAAVCETSCTTQAEFESAEWFADSFRHATRTIRQVWRQDQDTETEDDMDICYYFLELLCEDYETCVEPRWRDLYALYMLWQGNASRIQGGVFTGALMMIGDQEVAEYHTRLLLFPLLHGGQEPADDEWERRVRYCLEMLKTRGGNCLFGDIPVEESWKEYFEWPAFRAAWIPRIFEQQEFTKAQSFLRFIALSKGETGSPAK